MSAVPTAPAALPAITPKPPPPNARGRHSGSKPSRVLAVAQYDDGHCCSWVTRQCQTLVATMRKLFGSKAATVELCVTVDGKAYWNSAGPELAPPTPDESSAATDDPLGNSLLETLLEDTDMDVVRLRASKAFRKMVAVFKKELEHYKEQLQETQNEMQSRKPGGTQFERILQERNDFEQQLREHTAKAKQQAKLLRKYDRSFKAVETEMHDLVKFKQKVVEQVHKVDWTEVPQHIDGLVLANRPDELILQDICEFVNKLKEHNADITASNNELLAHIARQEDELEELKLELLSLPVLKQDLCGLREHIADLQQRFTAETARSRELDARVQKLEQEKTELLVDLSTQKSEVSRIMRATQESKPSFVGLGLRESIPPYLRFHGKLKNLNIQKGVLENRISEIWVTRYDSLSAKPVLPSGKPLAFLHGEVKSKRNVSHDDPTLEIDYNNVVITRRREDPAFAEFFTKYVGKQTNGHKEMFELSYSIVDACERFQADADVELFLRVLRDEIPEDTFYDQMCMIQKLKDMFARSADKSGVIAVFSVVALLGRFFPCKSEEHHSLMLMALIQDLEFNPALVVANQTSPTAAERPPPLETRTGSFCISEDLLEKEMRYQHLFRSDAQGNQGHFMECIRGQHLEEVISYQVDIQDAICELANGATRVSLRAVRAKLQALDPQKPIKDIEHEISLALDVPLTSLDWDKEYPYSSLITKFRHVLRRRRTPRTDSLSTSPSRAELEASSPGPRRSEGGASETKATLQRSLSVRSMARLSTTPLHAFPTVPATSNPS
eukprot:TRINITY_DN55404_c0_g1_i1.p1 TRINITY_DN55404_c0_g1~~TRINITY_DN55404_c0_g1_i1.p1  ORF type:complete len:793 (+),score=137.75 TRINITY_DN55404_c0_g1_i1:22-2379(+)